MNRDHFEGGVRNLQGRGKSAIGAVTGRARQQVEGAYDQVAGAAQYAYGEARDGAATLRRDGGHLVDEARERVGEARERVHDLADEARARGREIADRGYALADEARHRGRHYRGEAERRGRALAARADENRGVTLALVAAAAFGLGWILRRSR